MMMRWKNFEAVFGRSVGRLVGQRRQTGDWDWDWVTGYGT